MTAAAEGSDVRAAGRSPSALVALAAWGVVLVLRGRARRVVAVVGVLAAAGALVAVVAALGRAQDDALEAVMAEGATGRRLRHLADRLVLRGRRSARCSRWSRSWSRCVRRRGWPAMGSRYDAPAARADAAAAPTEQDMWRALDEGRDPTA